MPTYRMDWPLGSTPAEAYEFVCGVTPPAHSTAADLARFELNLDDRKRTDAVLTKEQREKLRGK